MTINVSHVTKKYRNTVAVDDATFTVPKGSITGFLGPNGAGKSTTMRMMTGLDTPTEGTVTIDGKVYADISNPAATVGCLLDAKVYHPKRSAFNCLKIIAQSSGVPVSRVDGALEMVGLSSVRDKAVGGFSLGMSQRLGIAAALLGDPDYVILDEPANGLDPEGIRWVRDFMRALASKGKTVLISSHQLHEVQEVATHLVIIAAGKIRFSGTMEEFSTTYGSRHVELKTDDTAKAAAALAQVGYQDVSVEGDDTLHIEGATIKDVGAAASEHGITVFGLSESVVSLEDAFLQLTRDDAQYTAQEGK